MQPVLYPDTMGVHPGRSLRVHRVAHRGGNDHGLRGGRYRVPVTESSAPRVRVRREVVSFVRRSSRMNPSQAHAWAAHRDRYVLPVAHGDLATSVADQDALDPVAVFGRAAPLIVEVGSGNGQSLAAGAVALPDHDFLAFEVFEPAVASTLRRLAEAGAGNARIVLADAAQGFERLLPPASVSEVWVFFPDPWHKVRHHKRRLVSTGFGRLVASRLVPGGLLRLATDWQDYADAMASDLDEVDELERVGPARFALRPVTRFEQRGLDAGRVIHDLTYRRAS